MTRWLSDILVGLVIHINVNGFVSNPIKSKAGVPRGSVLSPLLFLIYVDDLRTLRHKQNSLERGFADDTAQWDFRLNVLFAAKCFQQDLLNLAIWCAKLNPDKAKVIIFSRSILIRKTEPNLKLYGISPSELLSIPNSLSKKHFEDIQDCCNTRYHRLRLLPNIKWGTSPSILIQIYKQCLRPTFWIWIRVCFDHYHLEPHHQQNSTAPKLVYSACSSFTKIHLF